MPIKISLDYWVILYLIQSGRIYWNKTWWLWDFMAPSLLLITWFLNPKAYPINNLSLTMVLKQKAHFSLSITYGAIGTIVSLVIVGWGFNHNVSQVLKTSRLCHIFFMYFSPIIVFKIFMAKFFSKCITLNVCHIIKFYKV